MLLGFSLQKFGMAFQALIVLAFSLFLLYVIPEMTFLKETLNIDLHEDYLKVVNLFTPTRYDVSKTATSIWLAESEHHTDVSPGKVVNHISPILSPLGIKLTNKKPSASHITDRISIAAKKDKN